MRRLTLSCALACMTVLLSAVSGARGQDKQLAEMWSDPGTGFAIGGYDPVAYFVHRAPRHGKPGVELVIDGAAWKFLNEANRAVFARDPTVYAPRFAGRDPLQLARGFESLGNPHNWLIEDGKLYLFATPDSRSAWIQAPANARELAGANWSDVVRATQ